MNSSTFDNYDIIQQYPESNNTYDKILAVEGKQNIKLIAGLFGGSLGLILIAASICRISGACLKKRSNTNQAPDQPPGYPESPPPYFIACQIYRSLRRNFTGRRPQNRSNSPPPNYFDLPGIENHPSYTGTHQTTNSNLSSVIEVDRIESG